MKHKTNTYRSLSRLTFSLGSILLILGLLLGMFPQPVSATVAPEWDKSSLSFKGSCTGNCEVVKAKVCNTGSGDMAGPSSYEVYWAASGNPKNGIIVATGTIPALEAGKCTTLTYDPKTNPNGSAGNYMFKAYQRPGHPGQGVLWSDECSIGQCSLPTATPVTPTATPVTPTATPVDNLELSYFCTDGGQRWEVFNPNPFDIEYQWVSSTSASGSGTAPANGSDDFWVSGMGPMTITITYGNSLSLSATSEVCEEPTEEPTETPVVTETPSTTTPAPPTVTPTPFNNLKLTFMCGYSDDSMYIWRVRNTNAFAVNFTWDVYGGSESGSGVAPANSDIFFTTSTGSKTVRLFVNGVQNDVKASGQPCKSDLSLSYQCVQNGQSWTVSNPNDFAQSFTWSSNNGQSGSSSVAANGSTSIFISTTDSVTLTVTYTHEPFGTRSVSATSGVCEEPTEEPTDTPTETPVVTETPSPTPTEEVTESPSPTPTEEVTETPSPTLTEQPTKTEVPPTKTVTVTPVGTDDPGSPTPEITETVVTTPQPTSSGRDEYRDQQPPATLAPPTGSNTAILIPVTGGDLSQPKPFGTASLLFINFGLALLGFGLILNGLGRR